MNLNLFDIFFFAFKLQEIDINVDINLPKMTNLVKIVIVQLLSLHQEFFSSFSSSEKKNEDL